MPTTTADPTSDTDRIAACQRLWQSRWGKYPSPVEIARFTGIAHERVLAVLEPSKPGPVAKPAPRPSPVSLTIETLVCSSCGNTWTRDRVRGQKPRRCPDCR